MLEHPKKASTSQALRTKQTFFILSLRGLSVNFSIFLKENGLNDEKLMTVPVISYQGHLPFGVHFRQHPNSHLPLTAP